MSDGEVLTSEPPVTPASAIPRDARRNLLATAVGRLATIALSLLTTLLVIRYLGPTRYGAYIIVLTVVTLPDFALEIALFAVVAREIAKANERAAEWLGAATTLRSIVGVLGAVVLFAVPAFLPMPIETADTWRAGSFLFLMNALRTPVTYFRARLIIHWEFVFSTLQRVLELALVGLAMYFQEGAATLLTCRAISGGVFAIAVWAVLLGRFRVPLTAGRPVWRPLLAYSVPVALAVGLVLVQYRGGVLFIAWLIGKAAAGEFGAAVQIIEIFGIANMVISATAGPLLSRSLGRGDHPAFQAAYQRIFDTLVLLLPGCAVIGSCLAEPLVRLGFGAEYLPVVPTFRVLVWVAALIPIVDFLGVVALSLNLQNQIVKVEFVATLLFVAGNIALLPVWGMVASAWVGLAVLFVRPVWSHAIIRRACGYHLSLHAIPAAVLACIASAALILALTWGGSRLAGSSGFVGEVGDSLVPGVAGTVGVAVYAVGVLYSYRRLQGPVSS